MSEERIGKVIQAKRVPHNTMYMRELLATGELPSGREVKVSMVLGNCSMCVEFAKEDGDDTPLGRDRFVIDIEDVIQGLAEYLDGMLELPPGYEVLEADDWSGFFWTLGKGQAAGEAHYSEAEAIADAWSHYGRGLRKCEDTRAEIARLEQENAALRARVDDLEFEAETRREMIAIQHRANASLHANPALVEPTADDLKGLAEHAVGLADEPAEADDEVEEAEEARSELPEVDQ